MANNNESPLPLTKDQIDLAFSRSHCPLWECILLSLIKVNIDNYICIPTQDHRSERS